MKDLEERRKRSISAFAVYSASTTDNSKKKKRHLSSLSNQKNEDRDKPKPDIRDRKTEATVENGFLHKKSANSSKPEIENDAELVKHAASNEIIEDVNGKLRSSTTPATVSKKHTPVKLAEQSRRKDGRKKLRKKQNLLLNEILMESDENEANSQADMNVNVKVEPKVKKSQKNKEKAKSIKNDLTQLHGKDENGLNKLKTKATSTTTSKQASVALAMPFSKGNSEKDGQALFEWLIHPFSLKKFFSENWEKKPLLLRRKNSGYAAELFSTEEFNRILKECNLRYDVNLDVTTYQEGVRETHNVEGRAFPSVVWDYYNNGCSIRLKNPQSFSSAVWKLCSTLQEYFKSMVGANVYLTPAGTQGFAPHYDDIEAFVLQLEGKKHWSVYNPKSPQETLPRYSSKNFDASEIGTEIFTAILEPGDLLYFPRGFIHQARSLPDEHSLHITISTYQKNSWGDLFEELVPAALTKAIADDVDFRRGLPRDYLTYLGVQNCDKEHPRRKEILEQVSSMLRRLADHVDVDAAVDVRGASFLHDVLPPVLNEEEKKRSIHGASVSLSSPGRPSACQFDINVETKVCVVRKNALRLCVMSNDEEENPTVHVYHSVQNSRVYHEEEKKFFELELEFGPALEYLIHQYPKYVRVKDLPLDDDEDKINLVTSLFEKGLLLTEHQLQLIDSNEG